MKTLIKGGTVIAWDGSDHTVLPAGFLLFQNDLIQYVGESFSGQADETIDATGKLVIPGFVNTHCHVTDTAFTRGWLEDQGQRDWSGLYRVLPAVRASIASEDEMAAGECGFMELMLSGTTTVVELGYDFEMMEGGDIAQTQRIADLAREIGIRAYIAPRYRTGHWRLGQDGSLAYQWYEDRGRARFEDCVRFVKEYQGGYEDRIRTMLAPGQVDTCDPDLLRETRRVADETGARIQIHAGQSPREFREIRDRYGKTTVEYLFDTGLLGPDLIIGHGMFLSEDGRVDHCIPADLALLRESGSSIAHCPYVKARQGTIMQSWERYRGQGINVCLGTDTFPLNMIHEMRWAAVLCKVAEGNPQAATAREVFALATTAGARALGRDDLGRLAPGCKADIVLLDLEKTHAVPLRDPFKYLAFSASGSDVDTVIIDGKTIVKERSVSTLDAPGALGRLKEAAERVWRRVRL